MAAEALAVNSTIHTLDLLGNNLSKKVEDMLDKIMRNSHAYVTIPSEFQAHTNRNPKPQTLNRISGTHKTKLSTLNPKPLEFQARETPLQLHPHPPHPPRPSSRWPLRIVSREQLCG